MGAATLPNILVLKCILLSFELVSGKKVNFGKSKVGEIVVEDSFLDKATTVLHCKVMRLPFLYLGIPLGCNPRWISFWDPIFFLGSYCK